MTVQADWAGRPRARREFETGSGAAPAYVGTYGIRSARLVEGQLVYQRDGGQEIILTPWAMTGLPFPEMIVFALYYGVIDAIA